MRLLIVNPFASGVTDVRVEKVRAALGDVELAQTMHREHATELARAAGDAEAVYVYSGDGTFNEVLNGIGPDAPVGFIPGGGANVLPRALGLPRDPVEAAERLVVGKPRRVSVGRVNGRRFGFAAGLGLDAEAVRRLDAYGRTQEHGRASNVRFAWEVTRMITEHRGRDVSEILAVDLERHRVVADDLYAVDVVLVEDVACGGLASPAQSVGHESWDRGR